MDTKKAADDAIKASDAEGDALMRKLARATTSFGAIAVVAALAHTMSDHHGDHGFLVWSMLPLAMLSSFFAGASASAREVLKRSGAAINQAFDEHERGAK